MQKYHIHKRGLNICLRLFSPYVVYARGKESGETGCACADPEGLEGPDPRPWKIANYMSFYRNKHLDPPPPWKKLDPQPQEKLDPPRKCWAPSETLENDSFFLSI